MDADAALEKYKPLALGLALTFARERRAPGWLLADLNTAAVEAVWFAGRRRNGAATERQFRAYIRQNIRGALLEVVRVNLRMARAERLKKCREAGRLARRAEGKRLRRKMRERRAESELPENAADPRPSNFYGLTLAEITAWLPDERQRMVLTLHIGHAMPLRLIARQLGFSAARISQLMNGARAVIRRRLEALK